MEQKRNNKQIEADVKLIQKAAESVSSIAEISKTTGISVQKIRTSLKRHPIINGRVLASLEANRVQKKEEQPKPKKKVSKRTAEVKASIPKEEIPDEVEDFKSVTICDAPAMVYGLRACLATPVVIPSFVYDTLVGISKNNDENSQKAENSLLAIHSLENWCTIADRIQNEILLVDPATEKPGWREKAFVALCCKYWSEGYHVAVKTRTSKIAELARLQGCFSVDFVTADDEVPKLRVVS